MMFFTRNKAPSPAAAQRPLPPGRGEEGIALAAGLPLPSGERSRAKPAGEGAFSERDCAIWQDIRRALEGGAK